MNGAARTVISALALTPDRLRRLSRGADDDALATRPSAKEWSATEIVAHLRANADVWGSSIQRMLDEDHPTIRYVSPRGVMKRPEYSGRAFTESLKLFVAGRRKLVDTLKALPPEGWSREATFTGTTRRAGTVMSYAEQIAGHEGVHLLQFEALFNS
jgi:DinB family protein